MKRFLRAAEAADFICVAKQTLARWRVEGEKKLPFSRLGRAVVYDVDDLLEFVAAQKRNSTSDTRTTSDKAPQARSDILGGGHGHS